MTDYIVVGIEKFKSKNNIDICILYVTYTKRTPSIDGTATDKFFIVSSSVPEELSIGDTINVFYGVQGAKGFLAGIKII